MKVTRRLVLAFATIGLAVLLASGMAVAEIINGTSGADTIKGTSSTDNIDGYAGKTPFMVWRARTTSMAVGATIRCSAAPSKRPAARRKKPPNTTSPTPPTIC